MANSVGSINFGVGVDASHIAADIQSSLKPALAQVQAQLDRNPLKVKIQVDSKALQTAALREIRQLQNQTVKIKVDVDIDAAKTAQLAALAPALRAVRDASDKNIKIKVDVDIDQNAVSRLVAVAPALRAVRDLSDKNIKIKVDVDVDQAKLAALKESTKGLSDKTVKINTDSSSTTSASSSVDRLGSSLASLGKYTGIGALVGAGLAGIVGAAGAAAGAVGGLAISLAAVGPAAAGIAATAVVGLHGIKDAFSAMSDVSDSSAKDAKDQADKVASAQDAMASAADSAASAQESLSSAQSDAADAAKGVADAYKTAQERLDGYQQSLAAANLDEKEAALNLAEAQNALNKGSSDPLDYQRKILAVQRAQLNLTKAQQAGKKLQDEANTAQQQGIDQAPEVVAAKKKQADADRQVVDAQRSVQAANRQTAAAARQLADAQSSAGSASDKFSEAMAKLSPNAQSFVLAAKSISPALEASRKAIQDSLFANLGNQLKETATAVLPALTEGMKGVASELNGAAQGAFEFARSAQGISLINTTLAESRDLIAGFREGLSGAGQGIADLVTTAAPYIKSFGQGFGDIATSVTSAFTVLKDNGALDAIFGSFKSVLDGVGGALHGIIVALGDVAAQVMPVLGPLFTTLGNVIEALGPSLGQIGAIFTKSLTDILPSLGALIKALVTGLEPILPVLADLIKALSTALQPLLPIFGQIIATIGKALIDAVNSLAPALTPLATAFSDLLTAIEPIIPVLGTEISGIVTALAPALSDLFNALAPVIKQFSDALMPVIAQVAPILAQVAGIIAQSLVSAITALAPLLPPLITAWGNLVTAILPLIPPIVQLAVTSIPPLVTILGALLPVITDVINAFAWLVNNILVPVVVPAINEIVGLFKWLSDQLANAVDILTTQVFPALGSAIDKVKGWFSDGVTAISNSWDGLRKAAADPVNFVIDTVWNNGLLKAWQGLDSLLGGVLPDAKPIPLIPARATGGPLNYFGSGGSGNGTKDDILFWGSNNEHVITAAEVLKAGGQNIIYAIRDMIARGIPFTWDNGKIITDLGRDNLSRYGAAVAQKGIGNVPPEGLFDQLTGVQKHATGGVIMPWMNQLKAGHDFARAQDGKPYQWAGPRFVGDSFDCSGFMGSIIAAILGTNPWQRYWSTSTFSGYPSVGAQGLVKGLTNGSGMAVGITDDPGGPGGGHTAGELRGIPELGIAAARVESGGDIGNVHYGRGTNPSSFASLYGLPIGANGFFQPSPGGGGNAGPSTAEQTSFIGKTIQRILNAATDPIRKTMKAVIGDPPPSIKGLPPAILDSGTKAIGDFATHEVGNLGGTLGGVWQKATSLGDKVLSFFDDGGLATGTGLMAKNVIAPERVLSPEQTRLFEALVTALSQFATGSLSAVGNTIGKVTVDISNASISALKTNAASEQKQQQDTTVSAIERTASSTAFVQANQAKEQMDMLLSIADKLGGDVLGPVFSSAVNAGIGVLNDWINGLSKDVVNAVNGTTDAVNNLAQPGAAPNATPGTPAVPAFGQPGSAFDFTKSVSDAIVTVGKSAEQAFNKVAQDVTNAALAQTASTVGNQSKGKLGDENNSGGFLVDFIVKLTGVDIEILNLLGDTYKEIESFRKDAYTAVDANGAVVSDTAALVQRTATSMAIAQAEQTRIQNALVKSVIKYLITNILIPVITAILGAMITLATTAIGAAIGSAIPVIGTAIGAAVGAAVGAALTGLAAVFTGLLAVGVGGALDAFDEGGVAPGVGFMPKNTIAPERVLSPRQTTAFETLVGVLDKGSAGGGNRTVQIGSMNIAGRDPAQKTADNLLALLNT